MALTASDFTGSAGNLRDRMFPGETLSTLLAGWITILGERITAAAALSPSIVIDDEGPTARAFVLALAYGFLCEAQADPSGASVKRVSVEGEGSIEYASGYGPDYCRLAAGYRAKAGILWTVLDEADAAGPVVWNL